MPAHGGIGGIAGSRRRFNPHDFGTVLGWWTAREIGTLFQDTAAAVSPVTSNGQSVGCWVDKISGILMNADSQGDDPGSYVANGLNGSGIIQFAASQGFGTPGGSWPDPPDNWDMYALAKCASTGTNTEILTNQGDTHINLDVFDAQFAISGINDPTFIGSPDTSWHVFGFQNDLQKGWLDLVSTLGNNGTEDMPGVNVAGGAGTVFLAEVVAFSPTISDPAALIKALRQSWNLS